MSSDHNDTKRPVNGALRISRRDFLHDVSLASLLLAAPGLKASAATSRPDSVGGSYPPVRTGMRGAHPGSFEVAHQLAREGRQFDSPRVLDEHYDLVVVGAGISGLAAAYFYRQQHGPQTRILLLDNHDDFGGHAKRNEFHQAGEMRLAWGGTVNIVYPKYSETGLQLFRELGIDIDRLMSDFEYNWDDSGTGLSASTWFDRDTYGRDVLIPGLSFQDASGGSLLAALEQLPISGAGRAALKHFLESREDVLKGKSAEERQAFVHGTRYEDFLREQAGLPDEVIQLFSGSTMGSWGIRANDLSVAECLEYGLPGHQVLNLPAGADDGESDTSVMFPDGNASIARLLVRALIPASFPDMNAQSDPFDIVTARLDYAQLDAGESPVQLRLNSTVVAAANAQAGDAVAVSYVQDGTVYQVTGGQCVLACYNRIIPHLCPELPEVQKAALAKCIKRPMVTVNVLLKNGRAVQRSGISQADLPGRMLQLVTLVTGISTGDYRGEWDPEQPCVLHFFAAMGAENPDGLSISEQNQMGRLRLLQLEFADFEEEVHTVLSGVWGEAGLDTERDIEAITVNRWPHGYARDLAELEDADWLASPGPYEIGRQRWGNIAIANSDAGADAYTHTAIDQAWRAVGDLAQNRGG